MTAIRKNLGNFAAIIGLVLIAAGVSVDDLQQNLQNELDRQRSAGG